MDQQDLAAIVARVTKRALAEQRALHATRAESAPAGGTHASKSVVAEASMAAGAKAGRELVHAERLQGLAAGQVLRVGADALITPLARDEARRKGVRVEMGELVPQRCIAVGSDHGGFALKAELLVWIRELGQRAIDFGTRDESACDYPDYAHAVAQAVSSGQCELGVALDGAGIGSCMAANKVPGVRAATCCDVAMARNAREHNFANVLCLGAKALTSSAALEILRAFLATPTGEARHARRVEKIGQIERQYSLARTSGMLRP